MCIMVLQLFRSQVILFCAAAQPIITVYQFESLEKIYIRNCSDYTQTETSEYFSRLGPYMYVSTR
jgi:hypothetical protein